MDTRNPHSCARIKIRAAAWRCDVRHRALNFAGAVAAAAPAATKAAAAGALHAVSRICCLLLRVLHLCVCAL